MNSSNIIFKINYKKCKIKKIGIKSWMNYASKKQNEINILKDYSLFSDDNSFTSDSKKFYLWISDGDVIKKDELDKITDNFEGFLLERLFIIPTRICY